MINFVTVIDNGLFIKSMPLLMNVRLQQKTISDTFLRFKVTTLRKAKISKTLKSILVALRRGQSYVKNNVFI